MPPRGLFYTYHPAICMLFFIAAICFGFCSMQPVYVAISAVMACVYLAFLKGIKVVAKRILMFVPFTVFIGLLNSLFNHAGATLLFEWGFIQITLEGVIYGTVIGGMLVAVLMWFSCYNEIMTEDKFTYLFGRVLPSISLMISMISRWVPTMVSRGRNIHDSQEALIGGDGGKKGKVNRAVRMATVLVGLGMEDSIQTSDSMRARGYGAARRTTYARYSWHARETLVLIVLVGLIALNAVFMYVATSSFEYYPTMSQVQLLWWGYIPYVLMLALPMVVEVEEIGK